MIIPPQVETSIRRAEWPRNVAPVRSAESERGGAPGGHKISVVIPVWNEEKEIGSRLRELCATPGIAEVIVVDGGSRDGTQAIVRRFQSVRFLRSRRGRAAQMNIGAQAVAGDVILFLHADVSLPRNAAAHVTRALRDPSVVAGAFRTSTSCDGATAAWSTYVRLADLRSRYTGLPYGDQAMFVRRTAFERVGGFPDQALMEDLELSRRLRRAGRIATVPACVRVSGRRFRARPVASLIAMNVFPLLYRMGVAPHTLQRFYGDPR